MLISPATIQECNDADLVQVVQHYVTDLKKKGANYTACCPFHSEKTPSFVVSPAKGMYKCFGCGKGGNNPIDFVLAADTTLGFREAVEKVGAICGIFIEYDDSEKAQAELAKQQARKADEEVNRAAMQHWKQNLAHGAQYLRCSAETAELFDIGFAINSFTDLGAALDNAKIALRHAAELGLQKEKQDGTYCDRFLSRIMFPIYNHKKQVVGFTGRNVEENSKYEKYKNSPESDIFKKGENLFGIHIALESIRETGQATIVEGNWDCITLHEKGVANTVAPGGTAFTQKQRELLKKYCNRLLLIYDGDKPGIAAMHKNAIAAMKDGFVVDVLLLPENQDPDSFFRNDENLADKDGVLLTAAEYIAQHRVNYTLLLAKQVPDETDVVKRTELLKTLTLYISYLKDEFLRQTMLDELVSVTGEKISKLKKFLQEHGTPLPEPGENFGALAEGETYTMPKDVKLQWHEVKEQVYKYGFFTDANRIYMKRGTDGSFTFAKVSNFSIRIIQHMQDEKRPMRLVQIQNIHGSKQTFDTSTDDFVTQLGFKKMIEGKGNFDWQGTDIDFSRLCQKLKDDMGSGRMITLLGWQSEGFWCFNNAIITETETRFISENGCVEFNNSSYYVPSANSIYAENLSRFFPQKRCIYIKTTKTFSEVAAMIKTVHRHHAINALLFTVAGAFSDLIFERTSFFPLMFLYGEAGSGKDQIIEACQGFFGKPQTAISITGKANTDKAKVRKFAQFPNVPGHLSEYKNGNEDTDEMIKALWGRTGYERGTIDSSVGTESIQITMPVFFTGNDYPVNDALITRFIAEEMNKTEFSDEEKRNYEALKDVMISGYSSTLEEVLKLRKVFESDFRKTFKEVGPLLSEKLILAGVNDRMIQNAAVLGATYKLAHTTLKFPFTWDEFLQNIVLTYNKQSNKRATGSIVSHWWDCFLECVRDKNKPIMLNIDFSYSGNELFVQFSSVHSRYLMMHHQLFRSNGLSKAVLSDKLKKSDCWVGEKTAHRYGENRTSAYVFDFEKTGIKDDLIKVIDRLEMEKLMREQKYKNGLEPKKEDEKPKIEEPEIF